MKRLDYLFAAPALLIASLVCGCASTNSSSSSATTTQPTVGPAPKKIVDRENDAVYTYVDAMRADLSAGKVQIITQVMNLSAEEAKVFWPVYHDYETELFELSDQRVEVVRRFVADRDAGKLDDAEANALAAQYFDFETKRLDLLKAYHAIIAKQLSPVRAAQFTQIEHRVGTVIDLLIAAEMPLVQPKG